MIERHTPPHPVARLYLNQTVERRRARGLPDNSIRLRLIGDPKLGMTAGAYNAIVRLTTKSADGRTLTQTRQLFGPGGHNGKGGDLLVHFGLGDATKAEEIRIEWQTSRAQPTVLHDVSPGSHTVRPSSR